MRARIFAMTSALVLALSGGAAAADVFGADGRVFSGVAGENGEGLILPQTLIAGGRTNFGVEFDSSLFGPVALVTSETGGLLDTGLMAFPDQGSFESGFEARFAAGEVAWGLTPYVGVGLTTDSGTDRQIFQGMAQLLPFEDAGARVQGVAGIAYELMPGLGAGIEYRYQGFTSSAPIGGESSDNQTIMMRLDLGLN